jgi:hypothetical protein
MARQLRAAARETGQPAASYEGLVRMVYRWEKDAHALTERYALLYARALGISPDDLASGPPPSGGSTPGSPETRPAGRATVAAPPAAGNCEDCGARLARDNRDMLCSACGHSAALRPPQVPREFWNTADMPSALDSWHIGRVIYAYRTHPWHGRTLSQDLIGGWLGHPVPLTQPQVSRIESGTATENLRKLTRWAQILRIPSELLWFKLPADKDKVIPSRELTDEAGPAATGRAPGIHPDDPARGPLPAPLSSQPPTVDGEDGDDPVRRREFGMAAAMSALSLLDVMRGLPAELPERVAHGPHIDGEAATGLANVMLGYRQIYQSAGAAALLGPVRGTLSLLTGLAPGAGGHRDQIISLIGQAGSLTATMLMLDQGDYAAALGYLALAARAAQQSGDQELLSIAMAARAFHAAYSGDPADGLAFAREAVSIASHGAHPRTYGWVSAVESEMHATVGDEAGYRRSIETAQEQVTAPMPDTLWKGIGAFSEAKLTAYRGAGLVRLQRYSDAQPVLIQALSQLDHVQAKHRCTAHIDLADAYARDPRPKPDEAAQHAASALDIIAVTGHAESMRRVAGICQ